MDMEKQQWIEKILNSTNGMTTVTPGDNVFLGIQRKIQKENSVSPATVWLVAASITFLVVLNIALLDKASKKKTEVTTYLETTLNQSNQLY